MRPSVVVSPVSLVLLVLVLASACRPSTEASPSVAEAGASPSGGHAGSCDRVTTMSVCSEYPASQLATSESFVRASCAKLGGTFALAECPNTTVLGTCALATGELRKLYASGAMAFDAARAAKECQSYRGTWTPSR